MTWIVCTYCGAVVAPDGPDGLIVHLLAFHPDTPDAQWVMREVARLPLLEVVR
jgi:hypothetical protein